MRDFKWLLSGKFYILLGSCVFFSGCGLIVVEQESNAYRSEMANKDRLAIVNCVNGRGPHAKLHDHRQKPEMRQDCYLALLSGETTVMGEPPPPTTKPDAKREAEIVLTPPELARMTRVESIVGQVAWPALLSNIVYRKDVDVGMRSGRKEACATKDTEHPLSKLNAKAEVLAKAEAIARADGIAKGEVPDSKAPPTLDLESDHWEPWNPTGGGCEASGGLFYETFVRKQSGKNTQAFIVFRGTENYKGQNTKDWSTNFAMAMNITPRQFVTVKDNLPNLVRALQASMEGETKLQIFSAGHSLGGSLAQLAAYLNKDIKTAYVFNTSPVSGWTWLRRLPYKDMVEDPQVVRVAQAGEALKYVRNFSDVYSTLTRRTGRVDIGFDFPTSRIINSVKNTGRLGSAASLHSMSLLSCNLAARVSEGVPSAFGYSKLLAKAVLNDRTTLNDQGAKGVEGLCEVPSLPSDCEVDWIEGTVKVCREGIAAGQDAYKQDD